MVVHLEDWIKVMRYELCARDPIATNQKLEKGNERCQKNLGKGLHREDWERTMEICDEGLGNWHI